MQHGLGDAHIGGRLRGNGIDHIPENGIALVDVRTDILHVCLHTHVEHAREIGRLHL